MIFLPQLRFRAIVAHRIESPPLILGTIGSQRIKFKQNVFLFLFILTTAVVRIMNCDELHQHNRLAQKQSDDRCQFWSQCSGNWIVFLLRSKIETLIEIIVDFFFQRNWSIYHPTTSRLIETVIVIVTVQSYHTKQDLYFCIFVFPSRLIVLKTKIEKHSKQAVVFSYSKRKYSTITTATINRWLAGQFRLTEPSNPAPRKNKPQTSTRQLTAWCRRMRMTAVVCSLKFLC